MTIFVGSRIFISRMSYKKNSSTFFNSIFENWGSLASLGFAQIKNRFYMTIFRWFSKFYFKLSYKKNSSTFFNSIFENGGSLPSVGGAGGALMVI